MAGLVVYVLEEEGPLDRDTVIRLAAERAAEVYGIEFQRLRSDGRIANWIRSAINSGIRKGFLVRAAGGTIAVADDDDSTNADGPLDADSSEEESASAKHKEPPAPPAEGPGDVDVAARGVRGRLCVDFAPIEVSAERDVLVLQISSSSQVSPAYELSFVLDLVLTHWADSTPPSGQRWVAFLATDRPHYMGHSLWLGLTRNVPLPMCDSAPGATRASWLRRVARTCAAARTRADPVCRLERPRTRAPRFAVRNGRVFPVGAGGVRARARFCTSARIPSDEGYGRKFRLRELSTSGSRSSPTCSRRKRTRSSCRAWPKTIR